MRPTDPADYDKVSNCASFPLVPWSNRLRAAQFTFRGTTYQLAANNAQGVAQHGVGRYHPWRVVDAAPEQVTLYLDSRELATSNFPFPFISEVRYRLEDQRFVIETMVENISHEVFPVGFGHHPYFQRELVAGEQVALELPYTHHFPLTDGMADVAPVPVPAELDFRATRALDETSLDGCLTGRISNHPMYMIYPQAGARIAFASDDCFANMILFAPAGKPFYALEPVTNANDGFNLYEQGIPGSGVIVTVPGQVVSGAMSLTHLSS
jgi:aldose 1-epimerase